MLERCAHQSFAALRRRQTMDSGEKTPEKPEKETEEEKMEVDDTDKIVPKKEPKSGSEKGE